MTRGPLTLRTRYNPSYRYTAWTPSLLRINERRTLFQPDAYLGAGANGELSFEPRITRTGKHSWSDSLIHTQVRYATDQRSSEKIKSNRPKADYCPGRTVIDQLSESCYHATAKVAVSVRLCNASLDKREVLLVRLSQCRDYEE